MNTQPRARAARPGPQPKASLAVQKPVVQKPVSVKPTQKPAVEAPKPDQTPVALAMTCDSAAFEFEGLASTSMFQTLGKVRALPAQEVSLAIVRRSIAEARGYTAEELGAIAEVGYYYLRSGGYRLAEVIFDGLAAISPSEAYYQLALGLTRDHLGDKAAAAAAYGRASALAPHDPRPDINQAELLLESGNKAEARRLLEKALTKAIAVDDEGLTNKSRGLLRLLNSSRA